MDSQEHLRQHWYNFDRGYDNTNPGWYEVVVITNGSPIKHAEMVTWLSNNIDNPERHCSWVRLIDESRFKFRYERDYLWFRLTW